MRWLLLSLTLLLPLSASAQLVARTGSEAQATSESGRGIRQQAVESRNTALVGGQAFVTFLACATGAGNCEAGTDSYTGVRLRAYNIGAGTWEDSVEAFAETATIPLTDGYHQQPAIVRAGSDLYAFHYGAGANDADLNCYSGSGTAAPYYRRVPHSTWSDTGTWTAQACIPARESDGNALDLTAFDPACLDIQPVSVAGGFVLSCETAWRTTDGTPRSIVRMDSAGTWRGPFLHIAAPRDVDPVDNSCTATGSRQIFPKAGIVERGGVLWMLWTIKHSFGGTGCAGSGGFCEHVYNLYLAKSTNNGATWTDYDGGNAWTPSETDGDAIGFASNLYPAAYLIWQGDINQRSVVAYDVSSDGVVSIAARVLEGGGTEICGRPDQGVAQATELVLIQYDGDTTTETPIDTTQDWNTREAFAFYTAADRLGIVKMQTTTLSPTEPAYMISSDGGSTWPSAWQELTAAAANPQRPSVVFDPLRQRLAWTHYQNGGSDAVDLYLRVMDLTAAPAVAP